MQRFRFLLQVVLTGSAMAFSQTTYHVATTGNDQTGDGTSGKPYLTIAEASSVLKAGDNCTIHAGIFRETIKPPTNGTGTTAITYQSAAGENVFISAGDLVTGWTVSSGKIYKAYFHSTLSADRNQVFVNGEQMTHARYPNADAAQGTAVGQWPWYDYPYPLPANPLYVFSCLVGYVTQLATASTPGIVSFLPDGFLKTGQGTNFLQGAIYQKSGDYGWESGTITGCSYSGETIVFNMSNASGWTWGGQSWGYLTNRLEFLDQAKEWHYQNDTIYLWAPGGVNPNSLTIEAKARTLVGDLRTSNGIVIKGLKFMGGAVAMGGANCVIDGCNARYVCHYESSDPGANLNTNGDWGWCIGGTKNIIRNCSIEYSAATGIYMLGSQNLIDNCLVNNADYSGGWWAGIIQEGSSNITSNCTVYNTGRAGIIMGCEGGLITRNEIYNSVLMTDDNGSIYGYGTGSTGTEISYNWLHDCYGFPSALFYSDNGTQDLLAHHNVLWQGRGNSNMRMDYSESIYYNNTFVDSATTQDLGLGAAGENCLDAWGHPADWGIKDAANRDFTLVAGSKAIDKGSKTVGPLYTGSWWTPHPYPVPQSQWTGASPDLGAYEFGMPKWPDPGTNVVATWNYPGSTSATHEPIALAAAQRLQVTLRGNTIAIPLSGDVRAEVIDMSGRTVTRLSQGSGEAMVLSTARLARGVYSVRITRGAECLVKRFAVR